MPVIGETDGAVVVRTDFSDDDAWRAISEAVLAETAEGFRAYVELVDDRAFEGLGPTEVRAAVNEEYGYGFLMLVDTDTVALHDHPVLVVDLIDEPGRAFRALPRTVQAIDNNLSIANMDFYEFADSVGEDGIFRGF